MCFLFSLLEFAKASFLSVSQLCGLISGIFSVVCMSEDQEPSAEGTYSCLKLIYGPTYQFPRDFLNFYSGFSNVLQGLLQETASEVVFHFVTSAPWASD